MPTGLTSKIYEGKEISFREFALTCATQFGGGWEASDQGSKDLPLDKAPVMKVDDYYAKSLEKAKKDALYWINVEKDPELSKQLYQEYLDNKKVERVHYKDNKSELKERYQKMLDKVNAWEVSEAYQNIKDFMINQLEESIKHDCSDSIDKYYDYELPSLEEWLDIHISCACKSVDTSEESLRRATKAIEGKNAYLQGLYDELDKVEPIK